MIHGFFTGPELKCVAYEEAQGNWRQLCRLAKVPEENAEPLREGAFPSLGFITGVFFLRCVCAPGLSLRAYEDVAMLERAGLRVRSSEQLVVALNPFPAGLHTPSCPPEDSSSS